MGRHFLSAALFALLVGATPLPQDLDNADVSAPYTPANNDFTTDEGDHGGDDAEGGGSLRRPKWGKLGKHNHGLGKGFGKGAGGGKGRGEGLGKGLGHAYGKGGKGAGSGGLLALLGAGAGAGAGTGGLLGMYLQATAQLHLLTIM
jgi:hypothetical protein